MDWYKVIKTINGRRYLYWQKTKREGRRVRTYNKYIGPFHAASPTPAPPPTDPRTLQGAEFLAYIRSQTTDQDLGGAKDAAKRLGLSKEFDEAFGLEMAKLFRTGSVLS